MDTKNYHLYNLNLIYIFSETSDLHTNFVKFLNNLYLEHPQVSCKLKEKQFLMLYFFLKEHQSERGV